MSEKEPRKYDCVEKHKAFVEDVRKVLNCHGYDTVCNMPDFILADYVVFTLSALANAHNRTREWGKVPEVSPVLP